MKKIRIIPQEIKYIQNYLIIWFMTYWGFEDFKWLVKSEMFWEYWKALEYMFDNWNNITPELVKLLWWAEHFYEISSNVPTHNFIEEKFKCIKELFEWYIKIQYEWNKNIIEYLNEINVIYNKIEEVRTGRTGRCDLISLLIDAEKEIEQNLERWDWILWYKTGIKSIDKITEWLQPWTVMRLNAYSNTWKSKLSYAICNNILKQDKKVIYFSLEVTKNKVLLNLLANWYNKDYYTIAKWKELIDFSDYSKNKLEIIDSIFDIKDIVRYTEIKKPDVIFIDFVQNIKGTWNSEYERLSNIALEIQLMAIKNNIAVFDLSQIANEWNNYRKGWVIPSKWSWWLVASADVWLMMYKQDWRLLVNIAKNKFWVNNYEFELKPDFSKGTFQDLGEFVFWESNI